MSFFRKFAFASEGPGTLDSGTRPCTIPAPGVVPPSGAAPQPKPDTLLAIGTRSNSNLRGCSPEGVTAENPAILPGNLIGFQKEDQQRNGGRRAVKKPGVRH